jgi:hypothetical protein
MESAPWHTRKDILVPLLLSIISGFLPTVWPKNSYLLAICWVFFSGCIICLIILLVPSKNLRKIILTITAIALFAGGINL